MGKRTKRSTKPRRKSPTKAPAPAGRRSAIVAFGGVLAAASLLYLLWPKKAATGPGNGADGASTASVGLVVAAVPVTAGQPAQLAAYRLLAGRRDGMIYDVALGSLGAVLSVTPSANGRDTGNIIQEGGALLAEIVQEES